MARYLIEVPHEATKQSCDLAVRAFLETGSHFATHADWGCQDDEHKAWIIVELENKEEALLLLPPSMRKNAKIITLQKFRLDESDTIAEMHHK